MDPWQVESIQNPQETSDNYCLRWNDFESKQITSSVVPFFDKDLYTELYSNEPQKKRPIGIGNYF